MQHSILTPPPPQKKGKFDIFGASHQLWHLFVLLGFMWWFHGSWRMYEFRNERPCPANLLAAAPS